MHRATSYRANISEVVRSKDPERVARCIDRLRFDRGLDYEGTYKVFQQATGITRDDFEELCQLADTAQGGA